MYPLRNDRYFIGSDSLSPICDETDDLLQAFERKNLTEKEVILIENECKK